MYSVNTIGTFAKSKFTYICILFETDAHFEDENLKLDYTLRWGTT